MVLTFVVFFTVVCTTVGLIVRVNIYSNLAIADAITVDLELCHATFSVTQLLLMVNAVGLYFFLISGNYFW